MDTTRVRHYTDVEFVEEVQPVVIVGLPGPWYLALRIIGVYLILLATIAAVAVVVAIASCGVAMHI